MQRRKQIQHSTEQPLAMLCHISSTVRQNTNLSMIFNRITEWLRLGGTLKITELHFPCCNQNPEPSHTVVTVISQDVCKARCVFAHTGGLPSWQLPSGSTLSSYGGRGDQSRRGSQQISFLQWVLWNSWIFFFLFK